MGGIKEFKIFAVSQDPVYIGTGGYTIGRVDNTIVRDPITKIPKIPASSLAGTWRYYLALKLQGIYQNRFADIKRVLDSNNIRNEDNVKDLVNRLADQESDNNNRLDIFKLYAAKIKNELNNNKNEEWQYYWGNLISSIKCAGQDDRPNDALEKAYELRKLDDTGHCGHCIICKSFGYSKHDESRQGRVFFSDLNILFFPVSTRFGVRWITSPGLLKQAGLEKGNYKELSEDAIIVTNKAKEERFLNLGWLNLKIKDEFDFVKLEKLITEIKQILKGKIVLASDSIVSQIINANLEVRTSVSIDPLTGAAKGGALFTSEAIPRSTIFFGSIRIADRLNEGEDLTSELIENALKDSVAYYQTLGLGGLVTRGYGRVNMFRE